MGGEVCMEGKYVSEVSVAKLSSPFSDFLKFSLSPIADQRSTFNTDSQVNISGKDVSSTREHP